MTERSFGHNDRFWYGVVTNVMDPDMDGRVQIRIHGLHDDETNIPNKSLPWAKVMQAPTSAAHNKIGSMPVGMIVGTTVFGTFLDSDHQCPMVMGTISKAGDAANNETAGGSETLKDGTNSTPPGGRLKDNKWNTRANQNIGTDDKTSISYQNNYTPTEQNDSDGKDITAEAIAKTKFASNPTVASNENPSGSILNQLQSADPQNLNAVLPNAISSFIKLKDLNTFSTSSGITNVLGQTLGSALTSIASIMGTGNLLNALGTALNLPLSANASQALYVALMALNQPVIASEAISNVITLSLDSLINQLLPLLQNGTLTVDQFENLIAIFMEEIQNNGSQATLGNGITVGNILNVLSSVLPSISGMITTTLSSHLPSSVMNSGVMTQALQKFAMNQAYLKMPENGKKALATLAVSGAAPQLNANIAEALSSIPGVSASAIKNLTSMF